MLNRIIYLIDLPWEYPTIWTLGRIGLFCGVVAIAVHAAFVLIGVRRS